MSRDPIAALIRLARLKVDQARMDHARAQAAVSHIHQSIETMRCRLDNEQILAGPMTGKTSLLATQGMAALYRNLDHKETYRANLQADASKTLARLNAAIVAEERFAVHQARQRHEQKKKFQHREISHLEDLYLGHSNRGAGRR